MEFKHIGRYDVKSLIGQGGMSAVYLGYDPRALREVAIKVLPPYYLHATKFRERFEREALTIALLEHPAIVPVYDMGEEDGQPYIVMRYMSGGSLAEKLKRGSIPLKECIDMYLRLAPALDTAHARGVIHRDVKPDNLLFDKYNNVFLSDFGLARLRETLGFANISDGSIMGTPAYMSPEQIQGDREIDGRTDIYSLGVVLYHMLCGSVPFYGSTAASVMMMHLINPVPQIRAHNKTLPAAIQDVLETAMAKNPQDRYQTAGEFAKALQSVMTVSRRKLLSEIVNVAAEPHPTKRPTLIFPPRKSDIQADGRSDAAVKSANLNGANIPIPATTNNEAAPVPLSLEAVSPDEHITLKLSKSRPEPSPLQPRIFPWWAGLLGVVLIILLALTVTQWLQGGFPFSLLPASSLNPHGALSQNRTPATSSASPLVLGKADKLAILNASDMWISNLDGSGLVQLTTDDVSKSHLHWTTDGQSILYTHAGCIYLVGIQTKQVLTLTCFSGIDSINAFDVSPDGQNVALLLGQSDLYLFPYSQLFHLNRASLPDDLSSQAQCAYHAPYHSEVEIKALQWSMTNDHLGMLLSRAAAGIDRDEINILDFSQCTPTPPTVKDILPTYFLFTLRGYYDHPEISSFSWNGNNQLLLNGPSNGNGFGDLLLYDLSQSLGEELTPNGSCCYRDAVWSPDGSYIFYAFQPEAGQEISLYYVPYAEITKPGAISTEISLPFGFFTDPLEALQLALRSTP